MSDEATPLEKWPALISGAIGLVFTNSVTLAVSICNCLTADQTAMALALVNSLVAASVMIWQYRNMWSKASVEKVAAVDRSMTLKQAEKMVEKKP